MYYQSKLSELIRFARVDAGSTVIDVARSLATRKLLPAGRYSSLSDIIEVFKHGVVEEASLSR